MFLSQFSFSRSLADVDLDLLGGGRLGAAGERRGEMKLALVELSDVVMTFRVLDLDSGKRLWRDQLNKVNSINDQA